MNININLRLCPVPTPDPTRISANQNTPKFNTHDLLIPYLSPQIHRLYPYEHSKGATTPPQVCYGSFYIEHLMPYTSSPYFNT